MLMLEDQTLVTYQQEVPMARSFREMERGPATAEVFLRPISFVMTEHQ